MQTLKPDNADDIRNYFGGQ